MHCALASATIVVTHPGKCQRAGHLGVRRDGVLRGAAPPVRALVSRRRGRAPPLRRVRADRRLPLLPAGGPRPRHGARAAAVRAAERGEGAGRQREAHRRLGHGHGGGRRLEHAAGAAQSPVPGHQSACGHAAGKLQAVVERVQALLHGAGEEMVGALNRLYSMVQVSRW